MDELPAASAIQCKMPCNCTLCIHCTLLVERSLPGQHAHTACLLTWIDDTEQRALQG